MKQGEEMKTATALTGVLQDIHRTGLRVLEYALEQEGFKVVQAGSRLV